MEYFLKSIAESFYPEFRESTGEHCFVFPNRRAGLFFRKYLAAMLKEPVWSPSVMTINELFRVYSDLKPADNEMLLIELYKTYRSLSPDAESFDEFYFWGDMLLNDFDDTDKYLVDASKLFRHVSDLRKIDQLFGGVSEEQAAIIRKFWTNFNPEKPTDEKKKFISIWSILDDLYTRFRQNLSEKKLGYEGMIFRDVIENKPGQGTPVTKWKMFHFVGFNALNECEKGLMLRLKNLGCARFYWDYDKSYIIPGAANSAGYFLKENLKIFGNDMPEGWSFDTLISADPLQSDRRVIETSSDIAQVKLIPELISRIPGLNNENAHETAVILADENLLVPVLSSLPENVADVNITMGYPLRISSIYSLVEDVLTLHHNSHSYEGMLYFACEDVLKILKNGLFAAIGNPDTGQIVDNITEHNLLMVPESLFSDKGIFAKIFRNVGSPLQLPGYLRELLSMTVSEDLPDDGKPGSETLPVSIRNEFIYRVVLAINRIENILGSSDVRITADTWGRILNRLLRMQSVPFSGEPLSGIQIMGILESRALDFRNLIILSVNEGLLPSVTTSSSFIPFSLREAFGLPSINHQESVYAYHFYRLLHRAENVTFVFNSNSEGLRSGEMSRFLQQMKYDPRLKPSFSSLNFRISNPEILKTVLVRTPDHQERLVNRFSGSGRSSRLSPSAINMWLNCRMKFYYRYVCDLREADIISGEIDPAMLGTLLHETMKEIYSEFSRRIISVDEIKTISKQGERISGLILKSILKQYKRENNSFIAVNEFIVRNVLQVYINRILAIDTISAPFRIIALEKEVDFGIKINVDGAAIEIFPGGIADRIDERDGIVRIVDYKTGKVSDNVKAISDLFTDDRPKEHDGWLQTLLYCEAFSGNRKGLIVRPSVYKVKKAAPGIYDDMLEIKSDGRNGIRLEDYSTVRNEFIDGLRMTVQDIMDGSEPFTMTAEKWNKCSYCPYRSLCHR